MAFSSTSRRVFPGVTVAIPVLNGGPLLREVLAAVNDQDYPGDVETLVCDSGSTDGSQRLATGFGATVVEIPAGSFAHGPTRNRMMEMAGGEVVVFLTQDATPRGHDWLFNLLSGFGVADDVALSFGSFVPRTEASVPVKMELGEFFSDFSPNGEVVIDRSSDDSRWRDVSSRATFFTDSNGAILREAWERVPFPDVAYAEDRLLALRMLNAGYAKTYVPNAAVIHSHDYGDWQLFKRYFDEFRGLRETFGHVEPASVRRAARRIVSSVDADHDWSLGAHGDGLWGSRRLLESARYHSTRVLAGSIGSRSDRLPPRIRAFFSLEGRETFTPVK